MSTWQLQPDEIQLCYSTQPTENALGCSPDVICNWLHWNSIYRCQSNLIYIFLTADCLLCYCIKHMGWEWSHILIMFMYKANCVRETSIGGVYLCKEFQPINIVDTCWITVWWPVQNYLSSKFNKKENKNTCCFCFSMLPETIDLNRVLNKSGSWPGHCCRRLNAAPHE